MSTFKCRLCDHVYGSTKPGLLEVIAHAHVFHAASLAAREARP